MRRNGNVDVIQREVVRVLRDNGMSVQVLSTVGGGVPDLLVGFRGCNILLELKTEADKLNSAQRDWHAKWAGQVCVARDPQAAIDAVIGVVRMM